MLEKKIVVTAGISVLLTSLLFVWLQKPSLKVVKSWKQAETVNYNSFDPYFINIVEDNIYLGNLPFKAPQNYFIYVGTGSEEVTYGHIKRYSFEYNQNISRYLDECRVHWTMEGVTFKEPGGHTLFIPRDSFTDGR